jgi:hypothetical protein
MNLEIGFDYKNLLNTATERLLKYRVLITALVLLAGGAFVLTKINQLTETEVDQNYKAKQLQEINVVQFDEDAIDEIKNLNESNINITSDFTNRNNPFAD